MLSRFWHWLTIVFRNRRAVAFDWTAYLTVVLGGGTVITLKKRLGVKPMALLLTDTQKVTLSIQPVDAKGFPAKVDGVPVWTVSDPAVGSVVPAADGLSCDLIAAAPGTAQVNVQADADLGAGVRLIAGTLDIQVEPGEAVGLTVTAAAPVAQ